MRCWFWCVLECAWCRARTTSAEEVGLVAKCMHALTYFILRFKLVCCWTWNINMILKGINLCSTRKGYTITVSYDSNNLTHLFKFYCNLTCFFIYNDQSFDEHTSHVYTCINTGWIYNKMMRDSLTSLHIRNLFRRPATKMCRHPMRMAILSRRRAASDQTRWLLPLLPRPPNPSNVTMETSSGSRLLPCGLHLGDSYLSRRTTCPRAAWRVLPAMRRR